MLFPAEFEAVMPEAVRALPRGPGGWPVPWFVVEPAPGQAVDLRLADDRKRQRAVRDWLCWVCGQRLPDRRSKRNAWAFVVGPLGWVNRISGDWCGHLECMRFALVACPALNGTLRRRRGSAFQAGSEALPGAVDELPAMAGLYVTSDEARLLPEGVFALGRQRFTHWYRSGVRISDQEAQSVLREARVRAEAMAREAKQAYHNRNRLIPGTGGK